ncbi:MAG: ComEA family DNA-binding protein [Dehalococcoidia bacterium]|nr:ComEA family DNA-binding protein [Dehalococcoidia bacterium]
MNKIRTGVILGLLIIIMIGGVALIFKLNTASYPIEITLPTPSLGITISISGEVQNPGEYDLNEGSQAVDAVEAAGGFTPNADPSAIDLARLLRNGAQVYVPRTGERPPLININTADAAILDTLDGIGPTLAQRIIEYRVQNGPFKYVEELKNVKGIGDSLFGKIKDKIMVH